MTETHRDDEGKTALHLAAHIGHLDFVQMLLKAGISFKIGADVNWKDEYGQTALHWAVIEGKGGAMA